jgi:hypothetical protein
LPIHLRSYLRRAWRTDWQRRFPSTKKVRRNLGKVANRRLLQCVRMPALHWRELNDLSDAFLPNNLGTYITAGEIQNAITSRTR